MRDVARLAGASIATVSAVINGSAVVSNRLQKQIRDAMEALDYHPDQVARSLKVGRTDVIGMILPDITNAFFPELVRGAETVADKEGYSVLLADSNEDPAREQRHLSAFFSRRVDGVLIACSSESTAYETLVRRRFPIVFVDRVPKGLPVAAVSTDNIDAGCQAAQHLLQLGHERIAMITGDLRLSPHADRLEGFRMAMQAARLPVQQDYLLAGDLQAESGFERGRELLRRVPPPTAIVCSSNKMLLGLMQAVREAGIDCPRDLSIIGFDDYCWTANYSPRLTTVAQRTCDIGKIAMEMLLRRIKADTEHNARSEVRLLKAEVRARESTAPCAIRAFSSAHVS